jgi:hypothetical protein
MSDLVVILYPSEERAEEVSLFSTQRALRRFDR